MGKLILVRHGQSEWNALGQWTGLTDIGLTELGRRQARAAAEALDKLSIDEAYVSGLKRAQETLEEIKVSHSSTYEHVEIHTALNERNYGDFTGKNKWKIRDEIGEAEFQRFRRSWDFVAPNGESLEDVHARLIPFYKKILLRLETRNVLLVSHNNTLRALIKELENIPAEEVESINVGTGGVIVYHVEGGSIKSKEVLIDGGHA